MLTATVGLPSCNNCGTPPKVQRMGVEGDYVYFVVCDSDPCTRRKDNGIKTAPTPLSNGKPSQHLAEEDWRRECQERRALGIK